MKTHIIFICLLLNSFIWGQVDSTTPRIVWSVDVENPRPVKREFRYGETIDIEVRVRNYAKPMDITGAAVTLHARTQNMPEGTSYQVRGEARENGLAYVRVPVSEWLPKEFSDGKYTLAISQPDDVVILRISGDLIIIPTAAESTVQPVPITWGASVLNEVQELYGPRISILESYTNTLNNVYPKSGGSLDPGAVFRVHHLAFDGQSAYTELGSQYLRFFGAGGIDVKLFLPNVYPGSQYTGFFATQDDLASLASQTNLDNATNNCVQVSDGVANNLTLHGWVELPQTAITNLSIRLIVSNEYIIAEEIYK